MMSLRDHVEADGLVTIYDAETGAAVRRWPVDAAELLAVGGWSVDPVEAPAEEPAEVADAEVSAKPKHKK